MKFKAEELDDYTTVLTSDSCYLELQPGNSYTEKILQVKNLDVPVVPQINSAILAAIKRGGNLQMDKWHACETSHCRAGWAVHLAGKAGYDLEAIAGPNIAATLIYLASKPGQEPPYFYSMDQDAMADLERCAALEQEQLQ